MNGYMDNCRCRALEALHQLVPGANETTIKEALQALELYFACKFVSYDDD